MEVDRKALDRLAAIARDAGREIMAVYATDFASWSKDDSSPLTEADLRADRVIREGLELAFPGVFILSEESSSSGVGAAVPSRFFLVDPLDGTKEFLKRNDEFTVNIALVENGAPVAGVVYVPALDELFCGIVGEAAWKEHAGAAIRLGDIEPSPGGRLRVIGSRTHASPEQEAWLNRLEVPFEFVAAGSSLKFCRLAEGRADLYPRLGPTSQWDTAAAQAVLEAAGGEVLDATGHPLRYGLDRPVLNPHFIAKARRGTESPPLA